MAYYITVKGKGTYRSIDISHHYLFERTSKYSGDRYSLKEIDDFTSQYANELALREALLFEGLIDEQEVFKNISIRRKANNELIKVMYNPVFKESKDYLDINYLTYKIKSLACDYDFLNKLLNHYRNSHVNNEIIASIREFTFGNPEVNIYRLLDEFIDREVYSSEFDPERNCYNTTVKYKSLHDLAMFVYNYENNSSLSKEEIKEELKKFISYLKGKEKPKTRILSKKEEQLKFPCF